MQKYDVAIIGGGIAGMATALRLQAAGRSTLILESHGQPGGCAGYFSKRGFTFDVGATTLVDFEQQGVGGEFLTSVGLQMPASEVLDYALWLPGKTICMYRNKDKWTKERAEKLGDTKQHRRFWALMDKLANTFWNASRAGMKLPLQNAGDVINAIKCIGLGNLYMARYINYTVSDVLKKYGLEKDRELIALLSMLVEDTVNSTLNEAPVINAALGITIRGTGLRRAAGGMKGFWRHLINRYKMLGGVLLVGQRVGQFYREGEGYRLITRKGTYTAKQVLSAIPAENTINIAPENVGCILNRYVQRDKARYEGAIVMFLGVPDIEVACQSLTHHQIFYHHDLPLGNGNNMFISVSTQGDEKSAPRGFRPVMISTHCNCLNGKAFRPKNIC